MNKAILMGRLTKDPDIRYSQSNEPMCIARYTIAIDRRVKRDGEPTADFIPCVAFGKTGEFVEKFMKKGMQILISGRITVRSWEDQSGQRRWTTEIVVDEHQFTESRASFEARANSGLPQYSDPMPDNNPPSQQSTNTGGFSAISETIDSDDIPF